jgi:peptidyl-prolyl cis-trans isomerase SurA
MKFTFFLIITLLFTNLSAQQIVLDKTAAIVNDQIILLSDVSAQKITEKDSCITDCAMLKKMIIEKMLVAKAEKDSIMVSEEEVDNEMDRRMAYFVSVFGSQDKLEKYYEKSITELKVLFRDDVTQKLRAERTRNKLFAGEEPSPKQVKNYFSTIPKDSIPYFNAEIQMQQIIFFPKVTRENKRKAREKALEIQKKLMAKEADLGTQAILYSDDQGTASRGGELGWINQGEMVPEFEQAAYATPIGGLSDVFETRYGYHVLEVLDKKMDRVKVRHVLITPKSDDMDYSVTKKLADSISLKLKGSRINFEKAVELYSDDDVFKQNGGIVYNFKTQSSYFEIGELDPDLAQYINKMNVGEITDAMEYVSPTGKVGYRIVRLMKEIPPHKASIETDYSRIKQMNMESFRNEESEIWFNNYKHLLHIKIAPEFLNCAELKSMKL